MKWAIGDTCVWIASDTDGADDFSLSTDLCSTIPGTNSYFTLNGFSTPSILFTSANWMMRVEWN